MGTLVWLAKQAGDYYTTVKSTRGIKSWRDVFLVRELFLYKGCVRHEGLQDGRVDGPRRDGHHQGYGHKSLHKRRVQTRKRQLLVLDQEHGEDGHQEVVGRGEGDLVQRQGR